MSRPPWLVVKAERSRSSTIEPSRSSSMAVESFAVRISTPSGSAAPAASGWIPVGRDCKERAIDRLHDGASRVAAQLIVSDPDRDAGGGENGGGRGKLIRRGRPRLCGGGLRQNSNAAFVDAAACLRIRAGGLRNRVARAGSSRLARRSGKQRPGMSRSPQCAARRRRGCDLDGQMGPHPLGGGLDYENRQSVRCEFHSRLNRIPGSCHSSHVSSVFLFQAVAGARKRHRNRSGRGIE